MGDFLVTPVSQGIGLANGILGLIPPVSNAVSGTFNFLSPNARPDVPSCIAMRHRDIMKPEAYFKAMRFNGFDENSADALYQATFMLFNPNDYATLYRRGIIKDKELELLLLQSGLHYDQVEQVLKLTEYFPTPQDLILFAVRDVYTPKTVEEYKLDQEFPPQLAEECFKAGLPVEQAHNYWKAHWQLPSISAVTEMLHRNALKPDGKPFEQEDYAKFLRIVDISPQWRGLLEQISYQPLTRVDCRRMYEIGVIDRDEVKRNFLDLGYNDTNAELMTQFTTIYDAPETKGLTRVTISNAYVDGQISVEEMKQLLVAIGFQEPMTSFWIEQAQYDKAKKQITLRVDSLFELFLTGGHGLSDLRTELYKLDLPDEQVNQLIDEALIKRASKRKIPDLQTLVRWLQAQLIDERQFTLRMRLLNFNEEDIHTYLSEIALKQDTSARKYMKVDVYQRWLQTDIMDEIKFRAILKEQAYSNQDIEMLVLEVRSKQDEAERTAD